MKFSDHNYLPLNLYLLRRDSIEMMSWSFPTTKQSDDLIWIKLVPDCT